MWAVPGAGGSGGSRRTAAHTMGWPAMIDSTGKHLAVALTAAALGVGVAAGVVLLRRRRKDDVVELRLRRSGVAAGPKEIIVGCSGLAGIYTALGEAQAVATVKRALEQGFDKYDTAPHYGCGLSEERLGTALRQHAPNGGDGLRVWTKVGRVVKSKTEVQAGHEVEHGNVLGNPGCIFPETPSDRVPVLDYSRSGIVSSHRDSLRRLGRASLEGLRLHDAETEPRFAASIVPESGGLAGLVELRRDGAIKEVSAGMNDANYLLRLLRDAPEGCIDSLMTAGVWNLLDQSGYELLCDCQQRGVRVHNAGIYASGLLVGGTTYRYATAPAVMVERAGKWEQLAKKYGVTLPVVAMAFALLPEVVEFVAVGVKSPEEVDATLATAIQVAAVPPMLWQDAKAIGLLPEHIPTPS